MVLTDRVLSAIAAELVETGGPFDPAATWVGAASAVNDLGGLTAMGDVTASTGAVGTRVALTWGTPYKMGDGRWVVDAAAVATFTPASSVEGQTVNYTYLADALTAGNLLGFDQLPNPANLVDQHSTLSVVVRLTVDPDGRWSVSQYWNG